MTLAKTEVSQAQSAGAMEYAPVELRNAQSKLDQAQKALQSEEHVKAGRLAEQAKADAELASARSADSRLLIGKFSDIQRSRFATFWHVVVDELPVLSDECNQTAWPVAVLADRAQMRSSAWG